MSGSASKRPRPSYEDGKARDPDVQKMLDEADDEDGLRLMRLIKRASRRVQSKATHQSPS